MTSDPKFVGLGAERWPVPPLWKRLRRLVLENRALTTATFTGIFADLYENRPAFFLDQPIEYSFFRGAEISYRTLARFTKITWPGETITCRGVVTRKYEENGRKLVDCEVHTETESGERRVEGSATLVLG